jgi:hypothetical protein
VDPPAGRIAIASGLVGTVGVVFLILFYTLFFATPLTTLGQAFGLLNDVCVAIQYLLAIPLAISLRRILLPQAPTLISIATIIGIGSMLAVVGLQAALVFGVVTFQQQVLWVSLAMIVGIGLWLVITGLVARSTGRFPKSLRVSLLAVPYLLYPIWAFWLGKRLLRS